MIIRGFLQEISKVAVSIIPHRDCCYVSTFLSLMHPTINDYSYPVFSKPSAKLGQLSTALSSDIFSRGLTPNDWINVILDNRMAMETTIVYQRDAAVLCRPRSNNGLVFSEKSAESRTTKNIIFEL